MSKSVSDECDAMTPLPQILRTVAEALREQGARALIVGGAVRDMVMGNEIKDYDVEVYGLDSLASLSEILSRYGKVNFVGKSFGILKLDTKAGVFDFAFPRTERKVAKGHKGFAVDLDGGMSFEEAAKRRDFTVNALGYDILSGEIFDPYGGLNDIAYGVLRHIEDETFVEDPLRVYRAVQFAARFGFDVAEETAELCRRMVREEMLAQLPSERVYEEWKKLMLKASEPSVGFELMRSWGVLERHFPELYALVGVPQDSKWHPEGDVWVHTMMSVDAMASMLEEEGMKRKSQKQKLKLLFAVLCHDLGKPLTTTIELENGETVFWKALVTTDSVSVETPADTLRSVNRIRAIGHEKAGVEPTQALLYRLTNEHDFIKSVLPLVEHHLKPSQFYAQGAKAGAIRRLATKVNIEALVSVAKADFLGRTTEEAKSGEYAAGEWLLKEAKRLAVNEKAAEPLLRGRDLIALGLSPSARFKKILDDIYEMQMDGEIETKDDALAYVKRRYL